ncbi:hypothetical protein [Ferrimonas pelagia]|uniref:Uncharacterized protein n=1 Tax=Ferrimonas pelagia TaxID=1177826 RepID=A0ABP9FHY4_9GAMM
MTNKIGVATVGITQNAYKADPADFSLGSGSLPQCSVTASFELDVMGSTGDDYVCYFVRSLDLTGFSSAVTSTINATAKDDESNMATPSTNIQLQTVLFTPAP